LLFETLESYLSRDATFWEGLHRNWFFIGINGVMIGGQILIPVGGRAFQATKIDRTQWAICILCAFPCLLWAAFLRLFPDSGTEIIFHGAIRAFAFVFVPVWKCLELLRAMMAAIKRFSHRMWLNVRGKSCRRAEGDVRKSDEESALPVTVNEQQQTSATPHSAESRFSEMEDAAR
jgi:P-type Ca2+ transporter type 2C